MAEPNLTPWLMQYQLADLNRKTQIAGQMMNYLITWMAENGAACLQYEADVIRRLQEAGVPRHIVQTVRANFELFRRLAPVVQTATKTFEVAGPSIWQGVINVARTVMNSMAGGMQSFGTWAINGCRNMNAGLAGIGAALATIGSTVLRAAVSWVGANIGWGVIIGALVVIGLALILHAIWKSNRRQFRGDRLLEKAVENNSRPLMPHYQPGNA
jgi:hypothetical protein